MKNTDGKQDYLACVIYQKFASKFLTYNNIKHNFKVKESFCKYWHQNAKVGKCY
jgi:hypothetical protein